jgi:hypothetical protein
MAAVTVATAALARSARAAVARQTCGKAATRCGIESLLLEVAVEQAVAVTTSVEPGVTVVANSEAMVSQAARENPIILTEARADTEAIRFAVAVVATVHQEAVAAKHKRARAEK